MPKYAYTKTVGSLHLKCNMEYVSLDERELKCEASNA